jgi:hypothetical protein
LLLILVCEHRSDVSEIIPAWNDEGIKAVAETGSGKISGDEEDTHKLWSGLSGLRNSQTQKRGRGLQVRTSPEGLAQPMQKVQTRRRAQMDALFVVCLLHLKSASFLEKQHSDERLKHYV